MKTRLRYTRIWGLQLYVLIGNLNIVTSVMGNEGKISCKDLWKEAWHGVFSSHFLRSGANVLYFPIYNIFIRRWFLENGSTFVNMFQRHYVSNMNCKSFSNHKYVVMKELGKFTESTSWKTGLINCALVFNFKHWRSFTLVLIR